MGTALPVQTHLMHAQEPQSERVAEAPETFPDAPVPQTTRARESAQGFGSGSNAAVGDQSAIDDAQQNDAQQNDQAGTASSGDRTPCNISGTVLDVKGNVVPVATIMLDGPAPQDHRTTVASSSGAFHFDDLKPGVAYFISIDGEGYLKWKSPALTLTPGQYLLVNDIKLKFRGSDTSITVYSDPVQIATQQVIAQEHQRVFGVFPNFYVTYDEHPVPLTTGLKFRLAFRANTDVMTFVGVAFLAAVYQAGDIPNYGQGWDAYAKRVAAGYGDTTTDIFFGGAILPSLLHQDPRYFYQGTGTTKSRIRHAVFSPFVCKGDNGKTQPNYSSMGGDLISGSISNLYYPESNRGAGLLFQGFLVTTGVRMVNGLVQEFVLRQLTPTARQKTKGSNP